MRRFAPTLLLALPFAIALLPEAAPSTTTIDIKLSRFAFSPDRIAIPVGESVRLNVTSVDGTHGFQVKALGLNALVPGGKTVMVMHGVYREVVPPGGAGGTGGTSGRIVRTENMEFGCIGGQSLVTLELTERTAGGAGPKTNLTLSILFDSKEARDGALASGMEHGVAAGYDKLDQLLLEKHRA